jgi:Na+-driven multidrug efflux pump
MIYNAQLYAYAGEMGVSAYGVIMYVSMIFMAAFIGYMIGTAPIVGYHFGAKNTGELRSILKKSVLLVGVTSLSMALLSELLSYPLSALFVGRDPALLSLTVRAFRIFSISYLFIGYAIWGSGFFTALNDGVTSAIISFLRTLVFQVLAVLLLPLWLGVDGIWISLIFAEAMAVVILVLCLFLKRRKYQYF